MSFCWVDLSPPISRIIIFPSYSFFCSLHVLNIKIIA